MHAPTQFEIVNLKATNTEHEERLFGQAKDLAQRATNRQPSTVVPQILLRIQAKQKSGSLYNTYYQSISRVSKAMEELNKPGTLSQNTLIRTDFLTSRMSSWQQHLLRISPFLKSGPGVWWHSVQGGYIFHDSSEAPNNRDEGSHIFFTQEVVSKKDVQWEQIHAQNVQLPTPYITVYKNGEFSGRRAFIESSHKN